MAYMLVVWVELSPAFLEKARDSGNSALRNLAERALPILRKSMLWIIALGMLLPTMHQSSLGSLLLLSGPRLHPLWNTPLLPLLFLISCIAMGFGAVVLESTLSSRYFGRPAHRDMLASLGGWILPIVALFLLIRVADLVARDQLGALFAFDRYGTMTAVEIALFAASIVMMRSRSQRRHLGNLFRASMCLMAAGTLYRFDVYLLAFQPGEHWGYFPSLTELLITIGLVAGEIAAFIVLVRLFPILAAGTPTATIDPSPAGIRSTSTTA